MFGAIVLIFLAICIMAYVITGNQGIEERFANAVGLPGEANGDAGGILGFTLEGNHLSYVIILSLILVATALIYVKYRL
jgi:hypothetical protein